MCQTGNKDAKTEAKKGAGSHVLLQGPVDGSAPSSLVLGAPEVGSSCAPSAPDFLGNVTFSLSCNHHSCADGSQTSRLAPDPGSRGAGLLTILTPPGSPARTLTSVWPP